VGGSSFGVGWKIGAKMPSPHLPARISEWPAPWFTTEVAERHLRPVCVVTYDRIAFVGSGPTGPIRVTLDRSAVGYPIVLTKADKIKPNEGQKLVEATLKAVSKRPAAYPEVLLTSSEKGTGIPELRLAVMRATGTAP